MFNTARAPGAESTAPGTGFAKGLVKLLEIPGLLNKVTSYQDGETFSDYNDGDTAAAEGHLSLLRLKRALHQSEDKEFSAIDDAGKNDDPSVAYDTPRSGRGQGWRQEERVLPDMRFTHCAADWAAKRGHLDVVR